MAAIRALQGLALLVSPARTLRLCGVRRSSRLARGVVRVLGARQLVQAAVLDPRSRAGAAVDAVHAASMIVLAATDRRARTPALASAGLSVALAAAAVTPRRRPSAPPADWPSPSGSPPVPAPAGSAAR